MDDLAKVKYKLDVKDNIKKIELSLIIFHKHTYKGHLLAYIAKYLSPK